MFGYDTLENYFNSNLQMKVDYGFSIQEIEALTSWERVVYMELVRQKVANEEEVIRLRNQQQHGI